MRGAILLMCAILSAGLLSGPADARPRERQAERQEQQERQERREARRDRADRSASAAQRAQQRNGGGRVLSVDRDDGGYRVKVLKDGEVRTHHVVVED